MIHDLPGEQWRAIEDFEDLYEVSNLGRVRSLARTIEGCRSNGRPFRTVVPERIMRPSTRSGYLRLKLYRDGEVRAFNVANLVAATFVGDRPEQQILIRKRGRREDVAVSTIAYGPRTDCEPIKRTTGTRTSCERNGRAHLTAAQVQSIFANRHSSGPELAAMFGVTRSTIAKIRRGELWADLTRKHDPIAHRAPEGVRA